MSPNGASPSFNYKVVSFLNGIDMELRNSETFEYSLQISEQLLLAANGASQLRIDLAFGDGNYYRSLVVTYVLTYQDSTNTDADFSTVSMYETHANQGEGYTQYYLGESP